MDIKFFVSSIRKARGKLNIFAQCCNPHIRREYFVLSSATAIVLFVFLYFDTPRFTPSVRTFFHKSIVRSSPLLSNRTSTGASIHHGVSFPSNSPFNLSSSHHKFNSSDGTSPEGDERMTFRSRNIPSVDAPQSAKPTINSSRLTCPNTINESTTPSSPFSRAIMDPLKESSSLSGSILGPLYYTDPSCAPTDLSSMPGDSNDASANQQSKEGSEQIYEKGQQDDEEEEVAYRRPKKKKGECNLYEGKWVRDETYHVYRSEECPFIDEGFRCHENGRPDQEYLKWRWQPNGCNMPRFESEVMLNMLRGRRLVFVGDSIGRNQWESLLCMLGNAVSNKTRIYEVNGKPITKHKGFFIFKFEAYNCSIEYYRSPFLVPRGSPPRGSPKDVQCSLKVDNIDWTSRLWCGADVIVFNTGHWWNRQKTFKGNCYFQVGRNVNKSINVRQGFQMAMETWRRWVASNIDPLKTQVFFRTYAPVHFSDGTWKTGGSCDKEIQPYEEGTKFNTEFWTNAVVVEQVTKLTQVAHLLDITLLSAFRKDAHSSIYNVGPEQPRPFDHQDCSHWCLPGLPDTWNHILYTVLLRSSPWHS